jgi:hypothetical protein
MKKVCESVIFKDFLIHFKFLSQKNNFVTGPII